MSVTPIQPPPPPEGPTPAQKRDAEDPVVRLMIPVGRSLWAIAAGYLGLVSVCGAPAPLAILCGVLAIRDMRLHPERRGMGRAVFGIVMGALGTVLLAVMVVAMIEKR